MNCQCHLRNLKRSLQSEEKQLFALSKGSTYTLTELYLPPLTGLTHFGHMQQPNNKQPICSVSDFKHLCSLYLKDWFWNPRSWTRAPTSVAQSPRSASWPFCRLQTAGTCALWAGSWVAACFDIRKVHAPLGVPGILRAYVHNPFSTLVSPNQWQHTLLLWPDCNMFPLKGVCKAVAAC